MARRPRASLRARAAEATATSPLDRAACYRALRTRDARFDGRFYTCVVTTGIYCRPVCPARFPKVTNCVFVQSAAAAHQLGFRPCKRCRPELAPGLAGWRGSSNTVSRALRLIAEGAFDDGGAEELAARLGVGARHLRRLFDEHVGASPVSVAQTHRVLFARKMREETALSMTQIALASGFGSVRRFNDVMRRAFGRAPNELRRGRRAIRAEATPGIAIALPFSPPYDWRSMIDFLAGRAIPGVEEVSGGRYRRTFALGDARGVVEVRPPADGERHLTALVTTTDVATLGAVVARLRGVFDLDADAAAIDAHLARDARLAPDVKRRPGVRVPGAWSGFELAARAVLGQQVSVAAATTLAGRLAALHGEPLPEGLAPGAGSRLVFPSAAVVAAADLDGIGLTRARSSALRGLAAEAARDESLFVSYDGVEGAVQRLCALPGIGPWTARYIAMRALREPDAFPESDLGLLRAMQNDGVRPTESALPHRAEAWRPWRAYAALRLWTEAPQAPSPRRGAVNLDEVVTHASA